VTVWVASGFVANAGEAGEFTTSELYKCSHRALRCHNCAFGSLSLVVGIASTIRTKSSSSGSALVRMPLYLDALLASVHKNLIQPGAFLHIHFQLATFFSKAGDISPLASGNCLAPPARSRTKFPHSVAAVTRACWCFAGFCR